jgi:hypothetical protein
MNCIKCPLILTGLTVHVNDYLTLCSGDGGPPSALQCRGDVGPLPVLSLSLEGDDFVLDPLERAAFFIPSSSLMRRILVGNSETLISTRQRHSGHRNSFLVLMISSRHHLQKVCWQGNTLLDESSLSRHTEHSNSSFSAFSSIVCVILVWSTKHIVKLSHTQWELV